MSAFSITSTNTLVHLLYRTCVAHSNAGSSNLCSSIGWSYLAIAQLQLTVVQIISLDRSPCAVVRSHIDVARSMRSTRRAVSYARTRSRDSCKGRYTIFRHFCKAMIRLGFFPRLVHSNQAVVLLLGRCNLNICNNPYWIVDIVLAPRVCDNDCLNNVPSGRDMMATEPGILRVEEGSACTTWTCRF